MDNQELLTTATLFSALGYILIMSIKQLAPSLIKRIQSKWAVSVQEEQTKVQTEAAEDKLSIEAKSFLTEAAKDHLESIKNMAQGCQDEIKTLREEVTEYKIERASLKAREEVRIEEIQRIRNDYIEAKTNLTETKQNLEVAQDLVTKLQSEMSGLRQEMDRMHNQISVFETRLVSEQQNTRMIERRLEIAESELIVKDNLLKESKIRNDKLSQDVRDLQRKLREYAAKLHVVETNMETPAETLDTKELIAREYDDFSVTTQVTKTDGLKEMLKNAAEKVTEKSTEIASKTVTEKETVVINKSDDLKIDITKEESEVTKVNIADEKAVVADEKTTVVIEKQSDKSSELKKPITKKLPPVEEVKEDPSSTSDKKE